MRIVVVNTAASSGGALSTLKDFYNYVRENDESYEWIFIFSSESSLYVYMDVYYIIK